jgi:hypothetical protein
MASVVAVRNAIAQRLKGVPNLRVQAFPLGDVEPPAAVVQMPTGTFYNFDVAMSRGADEIELIVSLITSRADDEAGWNLLDQYLVGSGPMSVKAAIESGASGDVHYMVVPEARNYGEIEVGSLSYFGCELLVVASVYGDDE